MEKDAPLLCSVNNSLLQPSDLSVRASRITSPLNLSVRPSSDTGTYGLMVYDRPWAVTALTV